MDNKIKLLNQNFVNKTNKINENKIMPNEEKKYHIDKIKKRYKNIRQLIETQPEINLHNPFLFNAMQNNSNNDGSSFYHSMSISSSYVDDSKITHVKHKKYVNNNGKCNKKNIAYSIDQNGNKIIKT
jgi:hypothetical protein